MNSQNGKLENWLVEYTHNYCLGPLIVMAVSFALTE